jgi:hypothetical protein
MKEVVDEDREIPSAGACSFRPNCHRCFLAQGSPLTFMEPHKSIATEDAGPRISFQEDSAENNSPIRSIQPWQYVLIFIFACGIVIARRPDAIFHAQFFAEDGAVWFADAYNQGWWTALFIAHVGYYQTFARLGAAVALLVPFSMAPLVLNLIAIAVRAVPVNLILSSRSAEWGNLRTRVVLAALYLALPNSLEVDAGITNSQWILALSALLLLRSCRARLRVACSIC